MSTPSFRSTTGDWPGKVPTMSPRTNVQGSCATSPPETSNAPRRRPLAIFVKNCPEIVGDVEDMFSLLPYRARSTRRKLPAAAGGFRAEEPRPDPGGKAREELSPAIEPTSAVDLTTPRARDTSMWTQSNGSHCSHLSG